MPIITVSMFSGRTKEKKDRLAEAITESSYRILKIDKKGFKKYNLCYLS